MRNFANIERVVVKIGTNILVPDGKPDIGHIELLATDIVEFIRRGISPIIVSSGAIGFGASLMDMHSRPQKLDMRQACAAIGQPILMKHWHEAFARHNVVCAQILLSRETFDDRQSYLNLKNAVEKLLEIGVIPVMNENDSVCTSEIGDVFGDNDSLSAHIASKLDAHLLVLLTDIDALYDKNPREYPEAKPLSLVETITEDIRNAAGKAGSAHSTGGMITKIQAAEIASRAGCRTVLADGRIPGNLIGIIDGQEIGTLFAARKRMGARNRWILAASSKGDITVDPGAMAALKNRKSLLPKGIVDVKGFFDIGDVISINSRYKAVTSMGSEEIRQTMGKHSCNIKEILGSGRREEVIRAEDIVIKE